MIALSASWRTVTMVLLSLVMQTTVSWHVSAQAVIPLQQSFLLGTGSTEGTYHPVGVALSTLIKLKLLPSLNVDLTAINTSGSHENVNLLRQEEVQFAILSALSGYEAQQGIGRFSDIGPNENLRAVTALWHSADHVIVRKDSVQSGTIDDFVELRGQKMSLGHGSSDTLLANRALMAPLGVNIDTDFDLVELGFTESTEALVNGDITGVGLSGSLPIDAVQRVFDTLGDDAAILEFNDEQLALIDQGRRIWARAVIPAKTYAGQDRDIFTVGTPNILAVRADVDEEVVYQITKTIFENHDYLDGLHEATRQISLDTAINNLPLPVHEGALRYFEEKGVELPLPPVDVNPNLLTRFDSTTQAREESNRGIISMFTGSNGDTSARVAAELASILNLADDGFRLLPTFGGGSGQNLTDLLYLKGVDSALIRTDIVAYAQEHDIYPPVEDQIAYITEMFPEEVHLVVAEGINDIQELTGEKVNVGALGSGTNITASIILSQLDLPVQTTDFGSHAALDKLKRGEISGAFFVGGKPMPLLREIEHSSGLTLLSIPFVQYADSYRSASISSRDYPNLMAKAAVEDVSTLAVRTALFTYAWRAGTLRFEALANFSNALFTYLPELHQEGHHPKWREIDLTSQLPGWKRFDPARVWVEDNIEAAQRIALEGRYLIDRSLSAPLIVGDRDPLAAPLSLNDAVISPKEAPRLKSEPSPGSQESAILQYEVPPALETTDPTVNVGPALPAVASTPSTNGAAVPEQPVSSRKTSTGDSRSLSSKSIKSLPTATVNVPTF